MCPRLTFEEHIGFLKPCVSPFRAEKTRKSLMSPTFGTGDIVCVSQTDFEGNFGFLQLCNSPFRTKKRENHAFLELSSSRYHICVSQTYF